MQTLKLDLEHCYGISKLEHSFDFTQCKAVALYAPNDTMKSSLALTFQDIADKKVSSDRMFPNRPTKRSVIDEKDNELEPESVLIIQPYGDDFKSNEKTSTLLVNAELRKNYEELNKEVEEAKSGFLSCLKEQSGSKKILKRKFPQLSPRRPTNSL